MKICATKMLILMAEQEWTMGVLAEKSQVSRQTISYIKSGKTCTPAVACKIAKALNVDVRDILEQ